jgi:hypothetical protein
LSEIIKDEKYSPPSGAELKRRQLANLEEVITNVYDQETGKFIKAVKTKKNMNPLDSFF